MAAKWFVKSKTLIGVVAAAAPTVLPVLGISLAAEDVHLISEGADQIISVLGFIAVVLDRIFSSHQRLVPFPKRRR